MKTKLFKALFLVVFYTAGCIVSLATNVLILQNDGTTKSTSISDISKITFSNGSINYSLKNGNSESTLISLISKITFDNSGSVSTTLGDAKISLYPNPAKDYVSVSGIDGPTTVEIFSLSGSQVIKETVDNNSTVDVSALPSGMYLVKFNGHTLKLIKQ